MSFKIHRMVDKLLAFWHGADHGIRRSEWSASGNANRHFNTSTSHPTPAVCLSVQRRSAASASHYFLGNHTLFPCYLLFSGFNSFSPDLFNPIQISLTLRPPTLGNSPLVSTQFQGCHSICLVLLSYSPSTIYIYKMVASLPAHTNFPPQVPRKFKPVLYLPLALLIAVILVSLVVIRIPRRSSHRSLALVL